MFAQLRRLNRRGLALGLQRTFLRELCRALQPWRRCGCIKLRATCTEYSVYASHTPGVRPRLDRPMPILSSITRLPSPRLYAIMKVIAEEDTGGGAELSSR